MLQKHSLCLNPYDDQDLTEPKQYRSELSVIFLCATFDSFCAPYYDMMFLTDESQL